MALNPQFAVIHLVFINRLNLNCRLNADLRAPLGVMLWTLWYRLDIYGTIRHLIPVLTT